MKKTYWAGVVALAGMAMVSGAGAAETPLLFSGPGFSGSLVLTYGPATDAKYADGFEITGISGTFSDTALRIVDAPVTSLVPGLAHPSTRRPAKCRGATRLQPLRGRRRSAA